ncbi:MAG: 3,4-dihydroxy-2-butanone-4-phosphate synthase [Euryarchaeota archaeon]|nr:3,4-dihydroxy-2-butanone-4-phosphate synthase [Euryarchaeota archaeon]|tara:strand:- start:2793 stop:3500 length:708 start_codon:yes stop_codon:yes gene_type:complete
MESSELIRMAADAFAQGKPVMVFDSDFRECETDLLWPAAAATPAVMRRLRQDCGGLLFLAIGDDVGEKFGLPWLQDLHTHPVLVEENPVLDSLITDDLQYDTRSAFTLSLNHRETFTGITDHDRALTTRRFGELASEMQEESAIEAMAALGKEFRTPGHIPLCREAPGGLETRQGHTELAVAIARLAGLVPCTIGAEMLQPDGDRALSVEDARAYAAKHQIPMLTGEDIMKAFGL